MPPDTVPQSGSVSPASCTGSISASQPIAAVASSAAQTPRVSSVRASMGGVGATTAPARVFLLAVFCRRGPGRCQHGLQVLAVHLRDELDADALGADGLALLMAGAM